MTRARLGIAIGLLLLPLVARSLWFYQGSYHRDQPVMTPNYSDLGVPQAPASTPAPTATSRAAAQRVVLFDQAHDNRFNPPELQTLAAALNVRGARLEGVTDSYSGNSSALAEGLKRAVALLVVNPIRPYSEDEVRAVQGFVARGGRLMVITDPTRSAAAFDPYGSSGGSLISDVAAANSLLTGFGLAASDDYLYNLSQNDGNFRNVTFHRFAEDPLTSGLGRIVLYAANSFSVASGIPLIQGDANTLSSRTDSGGSLVAAALSSDGQVVAIGDMSFLTPPYDQVADNSLLIDRLAGFLAESERAKALADFPYLFEAPVVILPASNVGLTAELLRPLGALQAELSARGIQVGLGKVAQTGQDRIVLGTYAGAPDLEAYLAPFGLDLAKGDPSGTTLLVPEVGEISRSGTGLLLYRSDAEGARLVLLAADADNLAELIDMLATADLSRCVLRGGVGACGVGQSLAGDFSFSPEFPPLLETPYPTPPG